MSTYVIGDVQGCYDELQQLLDRISFDPADDTLWFVGDLVNRGTGSLQTLRFVKSLGNSAVTVLGNHDLHLLALYCGVRPTGKDPTLEPVLNAPDSHALIQWLLQQPLLHREDNLVMVHAGLHRDWSIETAVCLAREIETQLQTASTIHPSTQSEIGRKIKKVANADNDTSISKVADDDAEKPDVKTLHAVMTSLYGATEGTWSDNANTTHRLRYAVNCFTRMRFCNQMGTPDFRNSGPPGSQADNLVPWFELQNESQRQHTLLIGHWAAMGLQTIDNLHALDSGCVWGNSLTGLRLSDRKLYHIECTNY